MGNIKKVLVVGAGPTGLLLAYLLAKKGVQVEVFEAGPEVDQRPRGMGYGPSASRVLHNAGLLDEIRSKTWDIKTVAWRKLGGELLFQIDSDQGPDRPVLWPVHLLCNLFLEHVLRLPNATVHMSHEVIDAGQTDQTAWIAVKAAGEVKRFEGDFVVGSDGASSKIRQILFGNEFPGHTWDMQLVVLNIHYEMNKHNWSDLQWIVHPKNWAMVCGLSKVDEIWRICYSEPTGMSAEQIRERLPQKLENLLPGNPKPDQYEILRFSPFVVHQRCALKMRVGRILLVGDAAHICNPIGGLGLTTGISDVGSLADCLLGIHQGKADLDILEKYDQVRRTIFYNITDPTSTANLRRLINDPEAIRGTDPFFAMVRQAMTDPEMAEKLKQLDIGCDMTKYYNQTESTQRKL